MERIFFKLFCHQSVQLFSKSRRKFFNFCSTVFRKCMKIVRQAVLHTLDVWICIIVIFVAWCCIISTFPEPGSSVQFQINAHWLRTWLTEFCFFTFICNGGWMMIVCISRASFLHFLIPFWEKEAPGSWNCRYCSCHSTMTVTATKINLISE